MMDVREYIDNLEKAFKEIKRVLKDDGKLIIVTPDDNIIWHIIWTIWSKTFGKMWYDTHVSNYNLREWEKIISENFKILSIKRSWYFDLIFECSKK